MKHINRSTIRRTLLCLTLLPLGAAPLSACQHEKTTEEPAYLNISQVEAKQLIDTESDYVILDVRTQEEFDEGHIPGAILIPDYEIKEKAETALPDKNQLILVYCRSGRRSKLAAEQLEILGYTKIREFGGIIDWPYTIEKS